MEALAEVAGDDEELLLWESCRCPEKNHEYPDLVFVTRGRYLVLRADHEAFKAGRTTSAVLARAELMLERARAELMGGAS